MKERMNAKDYLALPYTRVLRKDDEGDFVARITELPGCVAHGATELEALEALAEAQSMWIEDAIEADQPIPMPLPDDDALPSGKWVQRVPRRLHQRLAELAKSDDVSLNQFVTSILAEAVGLRESRKTSEKPKGTRVHYHQAKVGGSVSAGSHLWEYVSSQLPDLPDHLTMFYLGELSHSLPNSCRFTEAKEKFDVHRVPVRRVPAAGTTARDRTR